MQFPGFRGILGQFCQALVGRWTRPALKPVSDLSLPSTHLPAGQASHIFTCSCHEECLQWQTGAPWVSTLVPKLWREVASGNLRWICLRSWPKLWNQMRALFVIFGVSWCRFAIQLCTGCTVFFSNLAPEHFLKILKSGQFFICPLAQDSPIVEVLHHIAPIVQVPSFLVKRSEWILNSEAELWHRFEQLGERSLSGKHRGYISGFQE